MKARFKIGGELLLKQDAQFTLSFPASDKSGATIKKAGSRAKVTEIYAAAGETATASYDVEFNQDLTAHLGEDELNKLFDPIPH